MDITMVMPAVLSNTTVYVMLQSEQFVLSRVGHDLCIKKSVSVLTFLPTKVPV